MTTIEFTNKELRLLHEALRAFLHDFGHDEAYILAEIKMLLAKLPAHEAEAA